ncbi:MAG: nucleotidyltransferase domain-containing protein [Oscillospiraceae bacterium]|nr:nucleotidyltransferase domain-containing protein [Oscillospiraceae bacterium]
MCREDAISILGEVYRGCAAVLPVPIHDAYLYGSFARGDFHDESDIDILLTVDLDWPQIAAHRRAISRVVSALSLAHDRTISVTVKPLALFTRYRDDLPFYRNVCTEGVRYVS